jgi:hypothetical protein
MPWCKPDLAVRDWHSGGATTRSLRGQLERLDVLETDEPEGGGDDNLGAIIFEQRAPGVGHQRGRVRLPLNLFWSATFGRSPATSQR